MSRKSKVTQEMANGFPEWTKVRTDDQSVGQSLINTIGLEMETLLTEMFRAQKSMFLTTAFTGEIDQTFKITLPNYFSFDTNNTNTLASISVVPTISGRLGNEWFTVEHIEDGSLHSFWYDAIPSRIGLVSTFVLEDLLVASGMSTDINLQLVNSGLDLDNKLTVVTNGQQLVSVDANNNLQRSKVRIDGITWKGTTESEDVVFLFAESKQTFKAWTNITKIAPIDFSEETHIDVFSHQFNQPYYIDSFESLSQFSESRENLPLFWTIIESNDNNSILQAQRYTAEKAIDLIRNQPTFAEYRSWELLDALNNPVIINDIVPVPNEQRIFAITNSGLLIYDTFMELPNLKALTLRTPNALIDIETSSDYIIREGEVEVSPIFKRPIKTIIRHRVKIKYPDGIEQGILLDGTLVPVSVDYWINEEITDRFIRQPFFLELTDLGQHVITLECVYLDQTVEFAQRAILVQSKSPLVQLDFSNITTTASGIDIDHQNRLLILDSAGTVHHMQLYYDKVLIDFENKELTFREQYDEIKVIK
jgi:hypothetical protein